jgi:hemerythrin
MKVEWAEYLSVGVAEIDDQHKLLFDKFNALLAACDTGSSADEVNRLFSFLGTYVVTHFSDEERLMQRLGFPDYPKHREMHQDFIRQVDALRERLESEGPIQRLVTSLTLAINGWLIEHISRMDRAVGRFVKEKKGAEGHVIKDELISSKESV